VNDNSDNLMVSKVRIYLLRASMFFVLLIGLGLANLFDGGLAYYGNLSIAFALGATLASVVLDPREKLA